MRRLTASRTRSRFTARLLLVSLLVPCALSADYKSFEPTAEKPYYFEDGKVDFGTYNGFRRYHADCHVCHGPAGLGSAYAPALMDSMKSMDWMNFVDVIVRGRQGLDNKVMPSFAGNTDVLANMLDIYAYLRARADDVIGPVRPAKFPKLKK
ncbi:MAG: cytochrome C [Gammaproteobacteria bacterium]|nr:cytochrome C [Gammaproteobacteria bacterium]